MGSMTVADTIREITRKHLTENNGLLLGQAVSAVGWVNNTVPNCKGIIELPMTDIAGAGIAVGTSLIGRRPIFVVRFQDFLILNGSPLIFYAAKSKELHNIPAPIFVRAIAAEGIGPVHSGVLHSIFMHFPGFRVCAPMTPNEYHKIWNNYSQHDDPMIVSEHRLSFVNRDEMKDVNHENAHITLYAISTTRFEVSRAAQLLEDKGIICNIVHILWLKPFIINKRFTEPLLQTKIGLVLDSSYEISGASRSIAYELNRATDCKVIALGLKDKTKCLCNPLQNKAPDAEQIISKVMESLG